MLLKDRIEKGEVEVEYCPSSYMIADFLENRFKEEYLEKSGR